MGCSKTLRFLLPIQTSPQRKVEMHDQWGPRTPAEARGKHTERERERERKDSTKRHHPPMMQTDEHRVWGRLLQAV